MELRQYADLVRKWIWLILLLVLLAAGSSYWYSRQIPPTYRADTTLLVGQALQNPNPNGSEFQVASQLAAAYVQLAKQQPVLEPVANSLDYPGGWGALLGPVQVSAQGNLIQVTMFDTDPSRAAEVADAVARQLIVASPTGQQQQQNEQQRKFVTAQLNDLTQQIDTARKSLNDLNAQAALETDPNKLTSLNARITALQTKIADWQKTYTGLASLLTQTSNNILTVITPAEEPSRPVSPNVPQNVLFATLVGLLLAIGAILVLEYLDDTVRDADDAQRVLGLNTIGTISQIPQVKKAGDQLVTLTSPRSQITEAYRLMRTNLRAAGLRNPTEALIITSPAPNEGKTTTASNLAVTLAQAGKQVILLDADLRRPNVHSFFKVPNDVGLSDLLLGEAWAHNGAERTRTPEGLRALTNSVLQATKVEGLRVMTSGNPPPNPAELLDSQTMSDIVESLRGQCDMLIVDAPPVLAFADARIVGGLCSAALLVVDAQRTRAVHAKQALESLTHTNVQVVGVALNRINPRRASSYGYGYYYYRPAKQKNGNGHKN